jgi:hypothetical protein
MNRIEIVYFNPNYWILSLGISLNRYVEFTENYKECHVRKELEVGLLVMKISFNFYFKKDPELMLEELQEEGEI